MESEEVSAASEDSLLREGESFGDVLERLREGGSIPAELIDGPHWDALTRRAGELGATVAAFPFGFGLPLHDPRRRADLGVSINGGSRTAAAIEEAGRSESAVPYVAGIARLLREMDREESALRRITDWELMLEYDIGTERRGAAPDPGIFLSSIGRPLSGDGGSRRFADIGVLLDSVGQAARRELDDAERREVGRVYRAVSPDTRLETVRVFPARERAIRLTMAGFRTAREVLAFLERAGWPGERALVADALPRFEARGAFRRLGVHLDVRADGVGPRLGIGFFNTDERPRDGRYWLDKGSNWTALIGELNEDGRAVPEKLSALSRWPGARIVNGRFGVFVLVRGIHSFELVSVGGRFEQVGAYVYAFLRSMPGGIWLPTGFSK